MAAAFALAGCGSDSDSGSDPLSSGGGDKSAIVIGSANFPESELLMQLYAQTLKAAGAKVETKPNIGAREIYMKAFTSGDIDLLPEYNGALLSYLSPDGVPEGVTSPDDVYAALQKVLPKGSETLPQSAAEDKDTLTVTKETADKYSLSTIEDLQPVAGKLTVGAGPEWRERYQGLVGLKDLYDVKFKEFKPLDSGGPLTVAAIKDGSIDVGNVFSTDSAITTNGWVVLGDPKNLYTSQNIVPLIQSDKVTPEVTDALNALSKALTTENLTEALAKVQVDKQDPVTVAGDFLKANGLS
ncbi:ABC transporter substrate-binding protein [Nocardioides sp. URHA0020]|uniref:ABC transporter substrate-binding protein n=1 Tax=Nocardioides sp. URHA0020 TaxID=1380392 RepID=UPI001E32BB74|nr:ABC transporter substrate-binding protein [Nocardioides sp. URHA0020]